MCEATADMSTPVVQVPAYPPIKLIACGLDVHALHAELLEHPELWDAHKQRTQMYAHSNVQDIWLRYNDIKNFDGDMAKFNDPHESVWYQEPFDALPSSAPIIFNTMRYVFGERLGGVLITKIPPGGEVKPHIDRGWHAEYYQKFAVQISADDDQVFCFEETELVTAPGDLFTFDNQRKHWVQNASKTTDRITMIICVKSSLNWLEDEGD